MARNEAETGEMLFTDFFIQPRPLSMAWHYLHWTGSSHINNYSRKHPTDMRMGQQDRGNFSLLRISFPGDSSSHQTELTSRDMKTSTNQGERNLDEPSLGVLTRNRLT